MPFDSQRFLSMGQRGFFGFFFFFEVLFCAVGVADSSASPFCFTFCACFYDLDGTVTSKLEEMILCVVVLCVAHLYAS